MLSDDIKKLEIENQKLKEKLKWTEDILDWSRSQNNKLAECCMDVIPAELHITKSRRNTTIKFRSGKTVTVKRKSGEKDCIETGIAYCIMKSILTNSDIKKLIKEAKYHE